MSDIDDSFSEADDSIESVIDDIEEDDIISEADDTTFNDASGVSKRLKGERQFANVLTKYELANIIGNRAKDFDAGVTPNIDVPLGVTSTLEIAEMELRQGKTPYIIRRIHADGVSYEDWSLKELIVPKL